MALQSVVLHASSCGHVPPMSARPIDHLRLTSVALARGPSSLHPWHPQGCLPTIVGSARARRGKHGADTETEEPLEEQIDVGRKAEAISQQLQLPANQVRALVRQHPAIVGVPVDKLCRCLPPLAHALGVSLWQALFMVSRQPNVLDADLQQLLDCSNELAAAVQLPVEQVMFMAARQPYLLDAQPARMASEARKLAAALVCSTKGALQLLSRLSSKELHAVLSMSSSTILQRLPEVVEALGLPSASTRKLDMLRLVAKHPALLAASLNDIGRSTDALLVAFQRSAPRTFAAVLGKCPSLLTYPAEQILANYQGLLQHLQISRQTVARMLSKHPQLLRSSPDNIACKLRAMAYHMYIPQSQVVSMCVRQPALLSRDSNKLLACLNSLQDILGTNYQAAVIAAARAPNLLLWAPSSLQQKHQLLLEASGLLPARLNALLLQQPGLLTLSTDQLCNTVSSIHELLQVSGTELGQLLLQDPQLLVRGGRVLQEQVQELQDYLAVPASVVAQLLRRNPSILAAGSAVWLSNINTLLKVLQLSPQQVQSAIVTKPQLLKVQPEQLERVSKRLAHLLEQQQPWQQEFQQLSSDQLAFLWRVDSKGLERLDYLVSTKQSGHLLRDVVLVLDNAKWAAQHPQFTNWLKRRRQQQRRRQSKAAAAASRHAAVVRSPELLAATLVGQQEQAVPRQPNSALQQQRSLAAVGAEQQLWQNMQQQSQADVHYQFIGSHSSNSCAAVAQLAR